jgi:hypothetical protein
MHKIIPDAEYGTAFCKEAKIYPGNNLLSSAIFLLKGSYI